MPEHASARRGPAARVVGLALATAGLATAGLSLGLGSGMGDAWGPRMVPLLAASALTAAGLADAAWPHPAVVPDAAGAGRVALLLGLAVLYVAAIDRVGYLLSTALAAPAALTLFGQRRIPVLVAAAIGLPVALHLVFFRLLGVFPPWGVWFDLLDVVPL